MTDNPPPDRLDYIIVPSYTLRSAQQPTSQTCATLDLAYTTYTARLPANPDLKIILSTGDNQNLGISNARVMADYLIDKGVPERALTLEEKSRDTFENLRESEILVKSHTPPKQSKLSIAIIAYDLHMRRIRLLARKAGWATWTNVSYLPATGPAQSAYGWRALQTSSRVAIRLYEVLAYVYEIIRWLVRRD